MSIERLKTMKDAFMCAVEGQMYNLTEVDAEELGEVVDMIKDLSEAIYYCEVAKAMEESEKHKQEEQPMYYTPMRREMPYMYPEYDRQYYGGNRSGGGNSGGSSNSNGSNTSGGTSNNSSNSSGGSSNSGSSYYTEREFPGAFQDEREGRSPRSRRMYMEAKETHQDKSVQMRELEKYTQELSDDVLEMLKNTTQEERQYISKKMSGLANKILQLND